MSSHAVVKPKMPRVGQSAFHAESDGTYVLLPDFCYPETGVRIIPTYNDEDGKRYIVELYNLDGVRTIRAGGLYYLPMATQLALAMRYELESLHNIGIYPALQHHEGDLVEIVGKTAHGRQMIGKRGVVARVNNLMYVTIRLVESGLSYTFAAHDLRNLGGVYYTITTRQKGQVVLERLAGNIAAAFLQERIGTTMPDLLSLRNAPDLYVVKEFDYQMKELTTYTGNEFLQQRPRFAYPLHSRARVAHDAQDIPAGLIGQECVVVEFGQNGLIRIGFLGIPTRYLVAFSSLIRLNLSEKDGTPSCWALCGKPMNPATHRVMRSSIFAETPQDVIRWLTYSEAYEWRAITENLEDL